MRFYWYDKELKYIYGFWILQIAPQTQYLWGLNICEIVVVLRPEICQGMV